MKITSFTFDENLLSKFIEYPFELYRQDPHWIPPFRSSVRKLLSQENSFFKRGDAINLLAFEGQKVVGRLSAINPNNLEQTVGLIGFFECENNTEIAEALISTASNWLKTKGIKKIFAPMNFDTWHSYRFQLGEFNSDPFFMEPYNKPYYSQFFENFGFSLENEYFSKKVTQIDKVRQRLHKKCEDFFSSDEFIIEPWRKGYSEEELHRLYNLSVEIFKNNTHYTEISESEFIDLYQGSLSLMDADLVFFAKNKAGRDVGFLYAFPEYGAAVRAMQGNNNWLAKLKFMLNKRKRHLVNIKSMGVVPDVRKTRLGAALVAKAYDVILQKGYREVNHCLMIQGNFSGGYDGGLGIVCGHYGLYSKDLEQ